MNETSGFITLQDRALYATAFLPETATKTALIIDPIGEEKRAAYRMLVRLARKLAENNIAAIKFDLSGTGDSTMVHKDASFETWRQDAIAAATEIQTLAKTDRLIIIAARAAALLAVSVANELNAEKIILAEPALSGNDVITDLQRRQNIKNMMSGIKENNDPQRLWEQNKTVDFGGFEFNSSLAEQLKNVTFEETLPKLNNTRVHAIRVSPSPKLPSSWNVFNGNAEIVADKPFWGQLDYYESDIVINAIINAI